MTFVAAKHDLGLLRQDGSTTVGLMLARDKNGAPKWQEVIDEYLAEQQVQEPGYTGLPYEKELRLAQSDWRGGFGLEVYDSTDPTRYRTSVGFDLRHRGMGILSNTPRTATLPTALSWQDTDFEEWDSASTLTYWAKENTILARESSVVHQGTYSAKMSTGAPGYLYQDAANWSNDYRGKVITIRFWCYATDANDARLAIDDGVDTSYSSFHTGTGAVVTWEELSVTHTFNASATRCRILLRSELGNTVYWDGSASIPSMGIVRFFRQGEFNNDMFFSSGGYLLRMDNSTGSITLEGLFVEDITSLCAFVDDYLYIAQGAGENYWYMDTSYALTQTDSKAHFFTAVSDTMWKGLKPRSIYSATDPTADANWSTVTTVDSSAWNITDMIAFDNTLYIMKEDRPFYLDSSGQVQVLTNTTVPLTSSTSGVNVTDFGSYLYMPWGDQGLLEYDSATGVLTWRNPSEYATRLSDFAGRVMALGKDEAYLYAVVDNGTKVEVLAGRLETIDSSTKWVWHPLHEITLAGCQTALVSSVYQKRLWISSTDSSDSVYYVALPSGYGNVENDTNRDFDTGGYFETPWLHGEFSGDNKAMIKITLDMGHSYDADIYFKVYYKLFEESSYTQVGTDASFKGTPTDRRPSAYINVSGKPSSTMIRFKIEGVTDDTTKTPILLGYDARAILFPSRRKIIKAEVRVGENVTDKQGGRLGDGVTAIKAALDEAIGSTPVWPVTIYDAVGERDSSTTRYVKFLPNSSKQPTFDEKNRKTEWHYELLMQEVTLT